MTRRFRWLLVLAVLGVVAAACGDAGTAVAPAPTRLDVPATTTSVAPAPTTADPVGSDPGAALLSSTVDGPAARDFALTLGTGTDQFVLGEVNKPVYLVFWADW